MKKLLYLLTISFFVLQSCSSNDNISNTPLTVEAVENIVTSGTWKITYLDTQGGAIKTSEFQGCRFTFNQPNTTTANYLNENFQGIWNIANPIENQIYFSINFQGASNLYYVDAFWKLISITNNKIVLKIDNDTYSYWYHPQLDPIIHPDDLIFEKI